MGDEFDRLAEQGRHTQAATGERATRGKLAASRRNRRMIRRALCRGRSLALFYLAWLGMGALTVIVLLVLPKFLGEMTFGMDVLAFAVGVLAFLITALLLLRRWRTKELLWLYSLPFELDVDAYLAQLTMQSIHLTVTMEVRFAAPLPLEAQPAVDQVILGASLDPYRCTWDEREPGKLLVVVSQRLETSPDDRNIPILPLYDNGVVHGWVHRCIARALTVVHGRYPIDRIDISVR